LCLLFANKPISLAFDWCTVLIANGSFLILLLPLLDVAMEAMGGGSSSDLKDLIGDNLQIGAYFILIGLITSFIFLIVAILKQGKEPYGNIAVCPACGAKLN
jgi:hypothetical protein